MGIFSWFINQQTLVGGLEHDFYDFPYIGNDDPNWRTHIFQRGRYTTNQFSLWGFLSHGDTRKSSSRHDRDLVLKQLWWRLGILQ